MRSKTLSRRYQLGSFVSGQRQKLSQYVTQSLCHGLTDSRASCHESTVTGDLRPYSVAAGHGGHSVQGL